MPWRKLFIRGKAGETQGRGIEEPEVQGTSSPAARQRGQLRPEAATVALKSLPQRSQ